MVGSCAEIIRRVADLIDKRLSRVIENILEWFMGNFLEIVRTEARNHARELDELRTVYAELREEQSRVRVHLDRTGRIARRLDRAGRALGLYEDEVLNPQPDQHTNAWPAGSSQEDASSWPWSPYM